MTHDSALWASFYKKNSHPAHSFLGNVKSIMPFKALMSLASFFIFMLLCNNLLTCNAYARFTSLDDAPFMSSTQAEIEVNPDGSYLKLSTTRIKVINEKGRSVANFSSAYNAGYEELSILEAKTIVGDKEYQVDKKNIEIRPLASAPQGFDEKMQVLISFPNVEVGSEVFIKTKKIVKPFVKGSFGKHIIFNGPEHDSIYKITSKIPLYVKINDPENALKVQQNKDKNGHITSLQISVKKPIYRDVLDVGTSEDNGVIHPNKLISFSVSSEKNWQDLGEKFSSGYEAVLNQPLPVVFQKIADAAIKNTQNDIDIINNVTSALSDKIHYMGDWRSIDGSFFPRDLEQIAASQKGDCKDFSASAGAILRKLGFQVYPALVKRGFAVHPTYEGLPSIEAFNHAFLKVVGKNGKIYWIDPTNDMSMAQDIFYDVAGKISLVLNPGNIVYEKVPDVEYQNNYLGYLIDLKIDPSDNHKLYSSGELRLKGADAAKLTSIGLYVSEKEIAENIFYIISGSHLEQNDRKELALPDLKSRIVQDLIFKFAYIDNKKVSKNNLGYAIKASVFADESLNTVFMSGQDRVTDIVMFPGVREKIITIKDIRITDVQNLNFQLNTQWFDIKRTFSYKGNDTECTIRIDIKKAIIPNEVLKTQDFQNWQDQYLKNFIGTALVLNALKDSKISK